jgi:TonB family protein
MPITEVPSSPPSPPPEKSPNFDKPSRYEDYDHSDLLHVIDELEGSRNWAALREKVWIALIFHMVLCWFLFYGPKYLFNVKVVDPSTVLKQREKEMTYLDLPKDLLNQPKPKKAPAISDKDRIQQSPHPTLDKKTLQQLEAMRRAGPPKESPAPPQPQPAPAPQPQQQAPQQQQQQAQSHPQPQQPTPPAQPLPNNQQSQLDAPKPAPTKPDFQTGHTTLGQDLQQMARGARTPSSAGDSGGDMGSNVDPRHAGMNGAVDVLSDTMGVNFGPYLQRVIFDTKRAWYPIIPEAARPPLDKQGRVAIRFKIMPDGSVKSMTLELPSGDVSLDRAAWGGITGASPYPPLPKEFKGPFFELRFYFLYNIQPGDQK